MKLSQSQFRRQFFKTISLTLMIKISISAVRLHRTYLASVERNVPRLFSIFLISRSLYFYLIIIKVFIFYLIIIKVFIPDISRFLSFYLIIISFFIYVYPKQLFNPLFTDHFKPLAAERAKKLDDIIGNRTRQRWVEK